MTVHVAGAGMAGLAAALTAARAGHRVVVHEAAAGAGGRCRSFFDPGMDRTLDNGTHVVLGANRAARDFLSAVGGDGVLSDATGGALPFMDLARGARWHVDIRRSAARALLACGGVRGLTAVLGLVLMPPRGASVAAAYGRLGTVYGRLIKPFATAVLNQSAEAAPAVELAAVFRRLSLGGRGALAPYLAPRSLSRDWIDPALSALKALGAEFRYHDPLTAIEVEDGALRAGTFRTGAVPVGRGDALILALPPWSLRFLSPHLALPPHETGAIICAHFLVSPPPRLAQGAVLMGMTGATAEWIAVRDDVLSVTVSAAERLLEMEAP
ncbi:MAG: FAD-dependent oxidoreductase, partial [Alphaproteobacteria bacterium]|nr:FAD-dependent oxidoreductase [Alphaproteobacteria bacterium]